MRTPLRLGRARGFAYAPLPPGIAEDLERWLLERRVDGPGTTVIKDRRVYRRGPHVYKFFPPGRRLRDAGRRFAAVRSAELSARLAPIATPAPLCALGLREGLFPGASLLASAFVDGRTISEVWDRDARAMDALADVLARMHRRSLFHGDFHPGNMLWDGLDWYVIDVGGMRHPLRSLRATKLALDAWAELDRRLGSPASLEHAFRRYHAALGPRAPGGAADEAWRRVAERSRELGPARSQPSASTTR